MNSTEVQSNQVETPYKEYSKMLEELFSADFKSKEMKDEIELLFQ